MAHNSYPLIIEQHPDNYTGYPFITLIVYGESQLLTIIDNQDKHNIYAYVLDFCQIEHIDEQLILKIANNWNNNKNYPISIEFANYLAGFLYAKDEELHRLFKLEIKRNEGEISQPIKNKSNKKKTREDWEKDFT